MPDPQIVKQVLVDGKYYEISDAKARTAISNATYSTTTKKITFDTLGSVDLSSILADSVGITEELFFSGTGGGAERPTVHAYNDGLQFQNSISVSPQPYTVSLPLTKSGVVALKSDIQDAIDTVMGTTDVTSKIDSLNEIINFLDGINNNEGSLFNKLSDMNTAINGKLNDVTWDSTNRIIKKTKGSTTTNVVTLSKVAISNSFNDLDDVPDLTAGTVTGIKMNNGTTLSPDASGVVNLGSVVTSGSVTYTANTRKITYTVNDTSHDVVTLATVATSGSYNDLTNKPTIVTPVQSDWSVTDLTSLAFIKNKPAVIGVYTSATETLEIKLGTPSA